ncbi:MAG TPA: PsbP-related protein [Nitrososphaeraceae archaeon]|nr:PsbP-related protein [Nitrososphaeraceae archaeon]
MSNLVISIYYCDYSQVLAFKPSPTTSPKLNSTTGEDKNSTKDNSTEPSDNENKSSVQATKTNDTNSTGSSPSFLVYHNSNYGFRISYPPNWNLIEGNHIPGSNFKGMDAVVAFVPPGELATSNGYTAFVGIYVDHAAKNLDMEEYLSQNVKDVMKDKILTNLIMDKANTSGLLSGQPAYVMSYSTDKELVNGVTKVITKEIGTKVQGDYYFIDYIAYGDRSDKYLNDAQKMVDSFEISGVQ